MDSPSENIVQTKCKVGDTLYHIVGDEIEESRVGAINIEYTMDNGTGWKDCWFLKDYNIGVTTFLTREDAEKALREKTNA